ncbi:MAG: SIR2 family protein [Myxococcota bacterium]
MNQTPGHVFIVQSDLTRIACDAWLMPCGADARPNRFWLTDVERAPDFPWPLPPRGWDYDGVRAYKLRPRVLGADGALRPAPWLVNVGGGFATDVSWFVDGVREFLARVADDPDIHPPNVGRTRPLVALPLVGTGYGGARQRAGEIVRALLPILYQGARTHRFDVALVIKDAVDYAAAQKERRRYHQEGVQRWPELDTGLRAQADELARLASQDELVLFLGSGVSVGAGLPTWGDFLRQLAGDPEQSLELDWRDMGQLGYGDQARILERGFGSKEVMGAAIAQRMYRRNYSLAHALLAAMPTKQTITTNYDTLFEDASRHIGRMIRTLPYEPVAAGWRWILKMHGCINHPDDIVVTREDYMRYAERRNALAGIVQALLLTKHMLFVGFSLEDDNFHRIADDVRKVVRTTRTSGTPAEPFGTSLVLLDRPFLSQMWDGEIELISMQLADHERPLHRQMAEAARKLEIFLDYLLAKVHDPHYLLNKRFAHLLSDGEEQLGALLLELVRQTTPEVRQTPSWPKIAKLLVTLGWNGDLDDP